MELICLFILYYFVSFKRYDSPSHLSKLKTMFRKVDLQPLKCHKGAILETFTAITKLGA